MHVMRVRVNYKALVRQLSSGRSDRLGPTVSDRGETVGPTAASTTRRTNE
jgi:hypothetical protein